MAYVLYEKVVAVLVFGGVGDDREVAVSSRSLPCAFVPRGSDPLKAIEKRLVALRIAHDGLMRMAHVNNSHVYLGRCTQAPHTTLLKSYKALSLPDAAVLVVAKYADALLEPAA